MQGVQKLSTTITQKNDFYRLFAKVGRRTDKLQKLGTNRLTVK